MRAVPLTNGPFWSQAQLLSVLIQHTRLAPSQPVDPIVSLHSCWVTTASGSSVLAASYRLGGADARSHLPSPVQLSCKSAGGEEETGLCSPTDLPSLWVEEQTTYIQHGGNNKRSGHVMSLGTSALLPSGREPPFAVTMATRGEGVGRCRAHAQYRKGIKGTSFGTQSIILTIYRKHFGLCHN